MSADELPGLAVFVGPDKTGSTWFYRSLSSSAAVAEPSVKDPHFFDRHFHLGFGWYEGLFRLDRDTRWVLDVSHDYIFDDSAIERITTLAQSRQVKVFVGVRDPIDRAHSAWLFMKSQGRIGSARSFCDSLGEVPELMSHGDYGALMGRLRPLVGSVVLFNFALLKRDPVAALSETAECLRLPEPPSTLAYSGASNSARAVRSAVVVRALRRASWALRRRGVTALVQRAKDQRLLNSILFSDRVEPASEEELGIARSRNAEFFRSSLDLANSVIPSPIWGSLINGYAEPH